MKSYLLLITFFFSIILNAQSYLPKAGEYLSSNPAASELYNRTGYNFNAEVIDFDSSNVSFRGNLPFAESYALGFNAAEHLAFVGSGGGILITDVSDPQNPVILSEIRTRSLVDNCTYDPVSKRLYVCAYFSGIEIWDLSNLTSPARMSRIPTEPYPRSGVAYSGNYIFVTTNNSLFSIDITDPYNPVFADELFLTPNLIIQMYKKDNVIFTVADLQGIKAVSISDPLNLSIISNTAYASGSKFDISGDYLYAVKNSSFTILNISDPANIGYMSAMSIEGYPYDIVVQNNKAYIPKAGTDGGLQIINVENPASPVSISTYPGDFAFIEGLDNYMFLTRNSKFTILNVSDPLSVQYVSGFELQGFVQDVSVSGKYAYTGSNGFRVIDLSDTTHPELVGYAAINGSLVEAASDSIVIYCPYSMTANNTIHVMDVSDPVSPISLDAFTSPAMTWDLVLKDNYAIVSCWWDGVRIFNFEDPSNISYVSRILGWQSGGIPGTEWCYAQAVAVDGDFLYIVDYGPFPNEDTYGLYIVDISNPAAPLVINRFKDITSHPQDISVLNGIAYIADGNGGLEIVDVSNPLSPAVLSNFVLPDGATALTVEENLVYVSNYILGGVQVIDVYNPSNPSIAGWYKPSGCFALNVEAANGYIFVSDGIAGIQVYRNLLIPVTSTDENTFVVSDFTLNNYPNPFNPTTVIEYSVPSDGFVSIKIYNALGEEVSSLLQEYVRSGKYKISFDASSLPSGIYFYKLESGNQFKVNKMMFIK